MADHDASLEQAVASWLAGYRSANTRAAYQRDLARFAHWCAGRGRIVLEVTAADLVRYQRAVERQGASASTVARRLSALSSFYEHACREGFAERNPVGSRPPVDRRTSGTAALDAEQLAGVQRAAAAQGGREAVLVALLAGHGLKLAEVLALDASDVIGRPPTALRLRTRRPPVEVRLVPAASAALARHLGRRRSGPLLTSGQAAAAGARLTRFGADQLLRATGRAAGLPFPLTSNVLRRTHVQAAFDGGEALDDLRARLGHRDARTTRRYLAAAPAPSPSTNRSGVGPGPGSSSAHRR